MSPLSIRRLPGPILLAACRQLNPPYFISRWPSIPTHDLRPSSVLSRHIILCFLSLTPLPNAPFQSVPLYTEPSTDAAATYWPSGPAPGLNSPKDTVFPVAISGGLILLPLMHLRTGKVSRSCSLMMVISKPFLLHSWGSTETHCPGCITTTLHTHVSCCSFGHSTNSLNTWRFGSWIFSLPAWVTSTSMWTVLQSLKNLHFFSTWTIWFHGHTLILVITWDHCLCLKS